MYSFWLNYVYVYVFISASGYLQTYVNVEFKIWSFLLNLRLEPSHRESKHPISRLGFKLAIDG